MCLARPLTSASMPCFASSSLTIWQTSATYCSRTPRFTSSISRDALVVLRLEVAEGQVFQLPLDLPDAQAVRQRRVDLHRLLGDAAAVSAGSRPQRAHVVQPVGQLDDHDADVLRHREEHLAQVLRLHLAVHRRRSAACPPIRPSLVTPSTIMATSAPKRFLISALLTPQSSCTSCSSAAAIVAASSCERGDRLGRVQRVGDHGVAVLAHLTFV